jgi:hypothetical protein
VLTVITPEEPTPAATMTGGSLIDEIVRNGHAVPWQVLTSSGAVEVVAPRVNDKRVDEAGERRRFSSVILPACCGKSPKTRWRAVNAPHPAAVVRAGARFKHGQLVERPTLDTAAEAA